MKRLIVILGLSAAACTASTGPSSPVSGTWSGTWAFPSASEDHATVNEIHLVVGDAGDLTGRARLVWPSYMEDIWELAGDVRGLLMGDGQAALKVHWTVKNLWTHAGSPVRTGTASLRGRLDPHEARFTWQGDFPLEQEGPVRWRITLDSP